MISAWWAVRQTLLEDLSLQHSSDLGRFQAAAASKKREEKGRKEQEEGVHCAGENSPLLREYGCYRDRLIIRLDPNSC